MSITEILFVRPCGLAKAVPAQAPDTPPVNVGTASDLTSLPASGAQPPAGSRCADTLHLTPLLFEDVSLARAIEHALVSGATGALFIVALFLLFFCEIH